MIVSELLQLHVLLAVVCGALQDGAQQQQSLSIACSYTTGLGSPPGGEEGGPLLLGPP